MDRLTEFGVQCELAELDKRYNNTRPTEQSFYNEQSPMKGPVGSARFLGNFNDFGAWYLDCGSNKIMRSRLS